MLFRSDQALESLSPNCNHIVYDKSEINVKIETEFLDLASDLTLKTETCETGFFFFSLSFVTVFYSFVFNPNIFNAL